MWSIKSQLYSTAHLYDEAACQTASPHRCSMMYQVFSWDFQSQGCSSNQPITLLSQQQHYHKKQDRRWNADKPSAALDPYIPTWLTISPANHRPANFWFDFFFFFLHSKEIVKSGATSCPTDEHQLQIWNSHSLTLSSTNNHQNYLLG